MKKLLWLLPLTAMAVGALACLLTGHTAAHAATIALAVSYLAGTAYLTDRYLPNSQCQRVRCASGAIFAAAALALLGFYTWHFHAENTIFINDDSLYYYMQLSLSEPLNTGLSATWAHFRESIGTDYTCLPNLLLAPVFSLTDRTADGFGLAAALMAWPLLMYQLRRITLRMADRLGFTGWRTLLMCAGSCIIMLTLPILHRAALWRQMNLLGLPLLLQVIILSRGMDFRRWQPGRAIALFASCVLLALTRRWFLFFLAGWLPLWGLCTLWRHLRRREWQAILRLCGYALLCAALGTLLLWPLLSRALAGNYAESYAYWRKDSGGLAYELKNQLWMLGGGAWVLIATGCLWGLLQRRSRHLRSLTAILLLCAAIGVLLFTRIQNMAYHQVTFLMPFYVLGLMLFLAMLLSLPIRWLSTLLTLLCCGALLTQWAVCISNDRPQDVCAAFSHVSLKPPVRENMDSITAVSDFIAESCTADAPALILMNSNAYDRLTFVTPAYPDLSMRQKVALDRTALVSDGFPRMWFAAKYIFVPTVPQTNQPGGTVEKLTHWLLADEADRFDVVATFPMDGFELLVMQRREAVTFAELEELLALFAQEHKQYPKVYGDRMGFFYGLTLE